MSKRGRPRRSVGVILCALMLQACWSTSTTVRREQRGDVRRSEVPIERSQWPYRIATSLSAEGVVVVLSRLRCVTQTNTPITVQNETTRSPSVLGTVVMGGVGAGLLGLGAWTWGRRGEFASVCPSSDPDCTTRDKAEVGAVTLGVLGTAAITYGVVNLFLPSHTETAVIEHRDETTASTPHDCPTPVSPIPLELQLPGGTNLQATTNESGRALFSITAERRATFVAGDVARLVIANRVAGDPIALSASSATTPIRAAATASATLGVARPTDGCIAGYVYAAADDNALASDYSGAPPVQSLWNCGWNVSVPQGAVGFTGLDVGASYAVRHQGLFSAAAAGRYTFPVQASHAYRMRVDGQLVEPGAAIDLSTGQHSMLVEYAYPAGSQFNLNIQIAFNGGAPQPWTFERGSPNYATQGVRYVGAEPLHDDYQSFASVADQEIRISEQIHFKTDSDELIRDDSSEAVLFAVAKLLSDHPEIASVEVQGHTDDQGNAAHNVDLSKRRANVVRQWLIDAGIAPHRLTARGFGKAQPIAQNTSAEGRALNRRVQFVIQRP